MADELGVPLLGRIPLDAASREAGDPLVTREIEAIAEHVGKLRRAAEAHLLASFKTTLTAGVFEDVCSVTNASR